jgi:PAS domain S-box-containing protein
MFHRYVSDKEEIVGLLDEVAGYSIENESIFENIGSALIVVDATGTITKVNHKAEEILEADTYEIIGKSCQVMSVDQQLSNLLLQTLRSGDPVVNHKVEWYSSEGYNYSLQVTTSPLRSKRGYTIGAVGVINDVTEIHDLQEKLKLNEHLASIGELSAKLGHEVGNSLSGIGLFADNLMSELALRDHRRDYAAEILSEIERLKSKVSAIKDYARPVSLDLKRSDLNELTDEVILFLRDKIQENDIFVKRDLDHTLSEIMIDPDQVRGALLNIIINATEAMIDGGELTISTQRQNGSVELSVSDTGIGIPEEIRSKIFNPFFTTKKALGTGLGLSIVCKSIQAHGGVLEFDSEEGGGTTFTIKFPAEMLVSEHYAESLTHG